jgi:peptidoglycan hydrolase-like protein with peptidoglycan-binding domain
MSDGGRRAFPATALAAALVFVAACSGGATTTTTSTTVISTSLPATTTTTMGRVQLQPNGPPFLQPGDSGAYVEALQFYLVCTGHDRLSEDGPVITVDGRFGPITANAVAYYQAELRRVPSGSPDEETFAQMARDCGEERSVVFPDHQGVVAVAGNVSPGDEEILNLEGVQGRVITIVVSGGEIQAALETAEGARVQQVSLGGGWSGKLATDTDYRLRVTGAQTASYAMNIQVARPRFVNIEFGLMRLEADGFGILAFGDDAEPVISQLQAILGDPTDDSGWATGDAGGRTCLGSNRHVTWLIQPADEGNQHPAVLYAHFSDEDAAGRVFAEYAYVSLDPQAVDAGAMDLSTAVGVTIGRTIAEFVAAYGQPDFVDGTSGMASAGGMMMGIAPAGGEDLVWLVGSGRDGCEGYE